mgnify:CR=1 FL=1
MIQWDKDVKYQFQGIIFPNRFMKGFFLSPPFSCLSSLFTIISSIHKSPYHLSHPDSHFYVAKQVSVLTSSFKYTYLFYEMHLLFGTSI